MWAARDRRGSMQRNAVVVVADKTSLKRPFIFANAVHMVSGFPAHCFFWRPIWPMNTFDPLQPTQNKSARCQNEPQQDSLCTSPTYTNTLQRPTGWCRCASDCSDCTPECVEGMHTRKWWEGKLLLDVPKGRRSGCDHSHPCPCDLPLWITSDSDNVMFTAIYGGSALFWLSWYNLITDVG